MILLLPILFLFLKPSDSAKIKWLDPTTHKFEKIRSNPKGLPLAEKESETAHVFRFQNISTKPIVIDNVRTDCTCTASEWSEKPIAPQEISHIKLRYDSQKLGYFRKKATVWINGQKKPERLWIEGEVVE
jgi:hypothetical protein